MRFTSDSDDSVMPTYRSADDGSDSTEFDEAVTSALTGIQPVPASYYRADGELSSDSGEIGDDEALEPGFLLRDRFEIVALVHSGGMGHVYKAIDNRRHRGGSEQIHVAIKMMRRSVAPQIDAGFALEREAAKTQRLSHPNIVNIFDFDQHDDQFYLVMEWLEGETVNALLRRTSGQQLAPEFAWRIVQGIASGLQHAHSNNVVHADINPSNIFITDTQEIKLLDFGVARYTSDPENAAGDRLVWATRTYASPDVLSGSTPTFEDDIFSLGCVAYRLLSGTHPFAGSSSSEAEEAGVTVLPIPGLSQAHWKTLSHALSYAKSDRPNSASAFIADPPATLGSGFVGRLLALPPAQWLLVLPIVGIAMAGLWLVLQSSSEIEPSATSETTMVDNELNAPAEVRIGSAELDKLLSSAAQAIDAERFVMPGDDNARDLYREVLARDPDNSIAMSGLRTISDVYVQQANIALRAGDPTQAIAALAIGEETDSMNPAVAIVNELLVAQGHSQLANAQLAAANGDTDRAAELLSNAERYPHVDVNAISALRLQIVQKGEDQQFLTKLAAADAHITAGRLLAPAGNNAQALLIELQDDYENDSRLLVSTERLGTRLLTRAAVASTAGQFPEATELLDAADALGVLAPEVTAARNSLQRTVEKSLDAKIAAAQSAPAELEAQETGEPNPLPASISSGSGPAPAAIPDSDTTVADKPANARWISLSDLAIEKFVAPRYPRSAKRRGLTGAVEVRFNVNSDGSTGDIQIVRAEPGDVFASSAENAVRQWRFAPRDDVFTTQVTLRFDQER
ncbi:MAG: TonB family protein [Gammaproteobacteria bacterium]|nr:TonB family protein [Gammaproteobacteria bacterium]